MFEYGVYVHVPFCAHRCDYCAFATYEDRDHLMSRYVDRRSLSEIERAKDEGLATATSVFFGGGTPSRLSPEALLIDPRRHSAQRGRRGHRRVQPRRRLAGAPQRVPRGRRHADELRRAVHPTRRARRPRATARHHGPSRGVRGGEPGGLFDLEHGPHRGFARRDLGRRTTHAVRSARTGESAPAPQLLRPHARTRDAARTRSRSSPRRGRHGRRLRPGGRGPRRRTGISGRRSRTGRSPGTSVATITCTGIAATTEALARPRTRTTRDVGSGTCARPIATSNSSRRATRHSGATSSSMSRAKRSSATHSPCAPRAGCRSKRSTHSTRSPTWCDVSDGRVTLTPKARLVANQVIVRLRSAG